MNSILAAAIGGGIGGLLGGLLAALAARVLPERARGIVRTIVIVTLAIVGSRVGVAMLAQGSASSVTSAHIEQQLLEDPNMGSLARAWRDADQESYGRFVDRMLAGARAGRREEEIVSEARAEITAAAIPRLLHLDDNAMLETARLSIEHLSSLQANQPSVCRPFFMGEPFGDITPYLTPDAVRRELGLLESAFRADISVPRAVATGEAFDTTLAGVLQQTRARVGDDVLMLTGDASAIGRDIQYCAAASAFYQSILDLPPSEGAAFLRGLRSPA